MLMNPLLTVYENDDVIQKDLSMDFHLKRNINHWFYLET